MTNTITSDLDEAHPVDAGDTELTSANSAAPQSATRCLTDGPVGRVGLEIEAHCFDLADPLRRPAWDELTAVIAGVGRSARRKPDHRRARRRGGTVRPADGRGAARDHRHGGRPGGAAFGVRRCRSGPRAARRRPAAARQARQPRRPLPRHGEFFAASQTGAAGGGDDDVDGVGAGEPRGGTAGRMGGTGPARARARPDDGRDRRQFAAARRQIHRLAQLAAVGVEPARLGPVRADPRR